MKPKKHIHKYHHVDTVNGKLWACAQPECSHHMPKHYEPLLIGKASICWTCEGLFRLNAENMKHDKPICEACSLGDSSDTNIESIITSIAKELGK